MQIGALQSTKEANAPPRSVGRARSTMGEVLDRLFHTYRLPLADVTWHQSGPPRIGAAFHGHRHVCGRPSASQRNSTVGFGVSSGGLWALRPTRALRCPPSLNGELAQRLLFTEWGGSDQRGGETNVRGYNLQEATRGFKRLQPRMDRHTCR